jgi:cellulose synthase/poly-beta-1,6-N-acetylglucosamine synthase-like glycosyltransferase
VICTRAAERWDDLGAAIASAQAQELDRPFEVLVVVDDNAALLGHARLRLGAARVVANGHAPGLSGARNTGVEQAAAPIVVFLDDDAVAEAGWLSAHVRAFDDPRVAGTGGSVSPAWDDAPPRWWPPEFDWVVGCTYVGWAGARARFIRNPIGANMAFRRDLVLRAGGFADQLGRSGDNGAGCEETDLAIRIALAASGTRIVAVPSARVRHRVPQQRATFRYFVRRCVAEGRSKAAVARRVGAGAATTAERAYVARTLPVAVARALREGRPCRAAAVIAGVACTTAGFATAGRSR